MQNLAVLSFWRDFWRAFLDHLVETVKVGDIGSEISRVIEPKILFSWSIGSFNLVVSDAIVVTWAVMIIISILAWMMGRNHTIVPHNEVQCISESFVRILLNLCQDSGMTAEQAEKVVPFVGTVGLFITLTNLSSLFKIPPPAKNPAFPIALALLTITYVIVRSIRFVGFSGFWSSLVYPKSMLLPFKVIDFMIKPISLSLRLFGNVFGAFILMEFIYLVIPVFIPGVLGLWFDLVDGILQGIIFTYLAVIYIGEIVEGARAAQEDQKARRVNA
jgi:F-type H+-transporting ATPase subunit a